MASLSGTTAQTLAQTIEGLGYEFVDAERLSGGLLRVTIDSKDGDGDDDGGTGIGLDDCERVSRQLTHLLAVENVDYARLEVSSPGLDRPLKQARDFRRFAGSEVQVQLHAPLAAAGGRKRLQGRLLELAGDAGAERIRLRLVEEAPAEQAGKSGKGARSSKAGGPARLARRTGRDAKAAGAVVEFALADVDKAKLVPELDFRGAGRRGAEKHAGKIDQVESVETGAKD